MTRVIADAKRTVVSAMNPRRFEDDMTVILLTVWFEELDGPVEVNVMPFDTERHNQEMWFRAMAGEYGPITILPQKLNGGMPLILVDQNNKTEVLLLPASSNRLTAPDENKLLASPPKMLEYHGKP